MAHRPSQWIALVGALVFVTASLAQAQDTQLVFIKIPDPVLPLERAEKYEDPLNRALQDAKLGEVSGGGSMLSAPDAAGNRHIEWVGVDADVTELDPGLAVLKRELERLGAPPGTVLEYERNGRQHELRRGNAGWLPSK